MSHSFLRAVRVAARRLSKSRLKLINATPTFLAEPLEARQLLSVSATTLIGQMLTKGAEGTYVTTFSDSSATETDTITVQGPATEPLGRPATRVVDHRVYRSGATTNTTDGTEWYGLTSDGYVEFFKYWAPSSTWIYKDQFTPPMVLLPPTLSVGQIYRSTYADEWNYIKPGGNTTGSSSHTRTITLASETPMPVTVPAGTFSAYKITVVDATINGGTNTTELYYAPGVGWVKSVGGDQTGTTTTVLTATKNIPSKLAFEWQPSSGVSGAKITPEIIVCVEDSDGVFCTSDTSSVTLAVKSGPVGGELGGTVTVAAKGGVATFDNVNLNIPGTYTLEATDGSLTSAVSKSFKIIAKASASKLAFTAQPTTTVAGKTIAPVSVAIEYPGGGIVVNDTSTVTLSLASGPGTLSGTLTANAVNGIATFNNLVLTKTGTYTLKATDGKLTAATSNSFKITPAAAAKLAFAAAPRTTVAGKAIAPALVYIEDRYGNIVTTNTSTVAMAIVSGGGTLSGTKSVAAKAGVATFSNLVINKVGTYTLKATNGKLTAATSASFKITPGVASKLVLATQPATITVAGKKISPAVVVDIDDAFGNIVTSNTSKVTLSVASGGGTFTGTIAVTAKAGIATFSNVILTKAGAHTLKAADGALKSTTSRSFTITPAAASKLVLAKPLPATSTAGKAISPAVVIDVEDQFGNIVTANKSNVTMSILTGPAGATLTGTATVAAKAGVATFSNLLLTKAGSYTLKAADAALTAAKTAAFKVNPAVAKKLVFIQPPTPAKANTVLLPAVTVAVEDSFGNIVTTDKSKVTIAITSGPGGAVLSGAATMAAAKGIATFANLKLSLAGTYKLKVTDGILTTAVSAPFVIT